MSRFPTDETTLTMLIAACKINPDNGQTNLKDGVCTMEIRAASSCLLAASSGGDRRAY